MRLDIIWSSNISIMRKMRKLNERGMSKIIKWWLRKIEGRKKGNNKDVIIKIKKKDWKARNRWEIK